jgi:hypothetical protein
MYNKQAVSVSFCIWENHLDDLIMIFRSKWYLFRSVFLMKFNGAFERILIFNFCLQGFISRSAIYWMETLIFFIYNLNQQSEFTFCKLMLWLLQCLDGESSSGESSIPQIRSIGQFLLSRLFSSLKSSVLRSGFSWVSSLMWCLSHFWWMSSCTYDMPRSACSVALETYHGASAIFLRILDWLLWIIEMLDLLEQPHNSRPYVQIGRKHWWI